MSKSRILDLEDQISRKAKELIPHDEEPAWPMEQVQSAYSSAVTTLRKLRLEIPVESEDPFWHRRGTEADRLSKALLAAVVERKRHSERDAARQLLGIGGSQAIDVKHLDRGGGPASSSASSASEAVEEAKAITESLRRTHGLLGQSLGQAGAANDALAGDGEVLRSVFDQHRSIGTTVKSAGKTLRRIQRQDEIDRWLMFFSTCFFVLTLVYVTAPRLPGLYTLGSLATSSASKLTKGLAPGAPTSTRGDGLAASAEEEEKRNRMQPQRPQQPQPQKPQPTAPSQEEGEKEEATISAIADRRKPPDHSYAAWRDIGSAPSGTGDLGTMAAPGPAEVSEVEVGVFGLGEEATFQAPAAPRKDSSFQSDHVNPRGSERRRGEPNTSTASEYLTRPAEMDGKVEVGTVADCTKVEPQVLSLEVIAPRSDDNEERRSDEKAIPTEDTGENKFDVGSMEKATFISDERSVAAHEAKDTESPIAPEVETTSQEEDGVPLGSGLADEL